MATERQSPDGLLVQTNLSGVLSAIQDDPDSPDGNWLTYITNNVDTVCRVSFPTPSGNPTIGAGLQEFKIWVRKQPGTGTPTVRIELYENGVSKAIILANTSVTSPTGELFSATWNANLLGTPDGSLVECYIYGTAVGGAPSKRCTVEVGAVEWNVTYGILDLKVGASSDDCRRELTPPLWTLTGGDQPVGAWSSSEYQKGGGMRFINVAIPQGVTVTNAYISLLEPWSGQTGVVVNSRISAERVDNAPTFADDADAFDARWANRTVVRVNWDNIPAWTIAEWYNSPNIKEVIQEIVNRAGWASGNAIVIFWEDYEDRSTHGDRCLRTGTPYDTGASSAPKLHIEWEAGAPPSYYHGLKVQGVGELALCDVGSHPLRIRKGGVTYGIELVATSDANASKVRIKTPVGMKAIRKYT